MAEVQCFMIEDTGRDAQWLRRYRVGDKNDCSFHYGSYHNAMVRIEDRKSSVEEPKIPCSDPRWPKACACGYLFEVADNWQVFPVSIFRDAGGKEYSIHFSDLHDIEQAPAGAMFLSNFGPKKQGHEGLMLHVILPNKSGSWCIDGPSNNGNGWTRSGIPPNVTAQPSILAGKYHGWLRDGKLIEC